MADIAFTTTAGQTIGRELLIAYLNTGTSNSPVWSAIGKRVEDSSVEFDWQANTSTDVLGDTYTTARKPTTTQSFEPWNLDSGDAALVKIWNLAVKDKDVSALTNQDMLIVHFYAANNWAERYSSCAILPSSLGGEGGGVLGMPIDVTYGGTRTLGTAARNAETGVVTFTPDAA